MYTLDLSGHDAAGKAGINRFGGLYSSIDDAARTGRSADASRRVPFTPEVLWIRDEEGLVALREDLTTNDAGDYTVTITSPDGDKHTYKCGGASDQEALIYAGKIVETNADEADPKAIVSIARGVTEIGSATTVADMLEVRKP